MALVAVPATVEELRNQRISMRVRSLNDDVEEAHLKLWDQEDYRKWFSIIWPSDSVEGNHTLDDGMVAMRIRTFAEDNNLPLAKSAKLGSIIRSLNVVRRRYKIGREQLRRRVGNESVDMSALNPEQDSE